MRRDLAESHGDRPAALLSLAVRGLPDADEDWGRAMCSELDYVHGSRARWRFSLGCARAAISIQASAAIRRPAPGATPIRTVVFGGIAAALALVAYGLVLYPNLWSASGLWPSLAGFVAVMAVYGAVTLALSASTRPNEGLARRYGLGGGLAIGAAWFIVLSPTALLKTWVALPLVVALLGPACIAALAGRAARDAKAATHAALWSGIVGGLVVFVVWVSAAYLRDGRPYDAGLVRDFRTSGAHDLATYAVSDDLGSALVLLLLVPTVALALGSLVGLVTARPARG